MIIDSFNYVLLAVILLLLAGSVLSRHRILLALFLIGYSELGNIFPAFGAVRFELLVGLLVMVMLVLGSGKIIERSDIPVSKCFYLFFLLALLSVPQSVAPQSSLFWFIYYIKKCFIYYFGIVLLIDDQDRMKEMVWMMMFCMFWFFGVPFFQYLEGNISVVVEEVERVEGATGLNPNGLANRIIQVLPLFYCMFLYEKRLVLKLVLLVMGVMGFITVFMTGSRGGLIGLIFLTLLIVIWSKHKILSMILGAGAFVVVIANFGGALSTRYLSILELGGSGVSAASRNVGLEHGISMLIKRPILGVGIGAYPDARQAWFNWNLWAHNLYGQLMGELGILGTVAWCLMIFYTIKYARRIRKHVENDEEQRFFGYLMLAVEMSTYARLVLGMTNHALHIAFWYVNAALVTAAWYITGAGEAEEPPGEKAVRPARAGPGVSARGRGT